MIERLLPDLQRAFVSEVGAKRVEADIVLLLVVTVALETVLLEKRLEAVEHVISMRLAKRNKKRGHNRKNRK